MIFGHKYKSKNPEKVGEIGLHKWECLKLKKQTGYFFKGPDNQALPFDIFKDRCHCIYLHHFNDHSQCNVSWCKVLKSQRQDNPLQLSQEYLSKFRSKDGDQKLFKMLKEDFAKFLMEDALLQVYHLFTTNKNESLNRRVTAVAPKDRFFSGTMSLYDRISNVVITDSVGYCKGLQRILKKIEGEAIELPLILMEWCKRKDRRMKKEGIHRKLPEVKRRRAAAINAEIRAGYLRDRRSKEEGMDYGSGIALDIFAEDEQQEQAETNAILEAAAWAQTVRADEENVILTGQIL